MFRRTLLKSTALLPIAGCATLDGTIAAVSSDADAIAEGLKGLIPQLVSLNIPGVTPAIVATVSDAVAGAQSVAQALKGVLTQAAAQTLVKKLETYVNAVVTALAGLPLPGVLSTIVQAAAVLLPVIETTIGLFVASAPRGGMSAAEARVVLKAAATK